MTITAAAARPARAKEAALTLAAPVKVAGLTPVEEGAYDATDTAATEDQAALV